MACSSPISLLCPTVAALGLRIGLSALTGLQEVRVDFSLGSHF